MSRHKLLGLLATLAIVGDNGYPNYDEADDKPKNNPVGRTHPPKGCKEYFFNESGEFSNYSMRKTECVFICIASNDKNAKRKFEQWKKENHT